MCLTEQIQSLSTNSETTNGGKVFTNAIRSKKSYLFLKVPLFSLLPELVQGSLPLCLSTLVYSTSATTTTLSTNRAFSSYSIFSSHVSVLGNYSSVAFILPTASIVPIACIVTSRCTSINQLFLEGKNFAHAELAEMQSRDVHSQQKIY
nr:hypothetical protein Iba_chr09bCG4820 [Ipomoea batatas]